MSRKTLLIAVCACVMSLAPASASAESGAPDFSRTGVYVAFGAGAAFTTGAENELRADPNPVFAEATVDESLVYGGRLGYRFSPHFAVEFDGEYVPGFDAYAAGEGLVWTNEVFTGTANIRGYWLTGRFQPYALVGAGLLYSNRTINFHSKVVRFAIRLGGGVETYITEHIFVDTGFVYQLPFGESQKMDYMTVRGSLGYKF